MNRKNINRVIFAKITEWVNSIEDENLKNTIKNNVIVTGGCITSLLLNEEVNDYDIYFKNKETVLKIAQYYVELFKKRENENVKPKIIDENGRVKIFISSDGIAKAESEKGVVEYVERLDELKIPEFDKKDKYRPVYLTDNAITLYDKIQLIIRFYGSPEEIHKNYDFVHCTNYWTFEDGIVLKPEALESILNKELKYQGSLYPICSIIRTRKFIYRGWFINAGQYVKMAYQISKLDLEDISVLQEQLVGVDSYYFRQLISELEKVNKEKIDELYICNLIDKLF
jgi:hypothetical protein